MFDYYWGEIIGIEDDRIVYVNSPHCYGEHLDTDLPGVIDIRLPGVMSRKPKVGDIVEYICSCDEQQVCIGIFVRFKNEPTVYLS